MVTAAMKLKDVLALKIGRWQQAKECGRLLDVMALK